MKLGALEERMQSERRGRSMWEGGRAPLEVRCRCHQVSRYSLKAAFKALDSIARSRQANFLLLLLRGRSVAIWRPQIQFIIC